MKEPEGVPGRIEVNGYRMRRGSACKPIKFMDMSFLDQQ